VKPDAALAVPLSVMARAALPRTPVGRLLTLALVLALVLGLDAARASAEVLAQLGPESAVDRRTHESAERLLMDPVDVRGLVHVAARAAARRLAALLDARLPRDRRAAL
jgi:hypothetical protein